MLLLASQAQGLAEHRDLRIDPNRDCHAVTPAHRHRVTVAAAHARSRISPCDRRYLSHSSKR